MFKFDLLLYYHFSKGTKKPSDSHEQEGINKYQTSSYTWNEFDANIKIPSQTKRISGSSGIWSDGLMCAIPSYD